MNDTTTNLFDFLNESTTDIEFSETETGTSDISITDITELPFTITETISETVPFLQKPFKDYSNIEFSNTLICIILTVILLVLSFKKF